uniref:Putative tail protein n=1 Tax=viral metagenome TaxID=1070528 RepID=A0A6M3IFZ8_9ZZZZ
MAAGGRNELRWKIIADTSKGITNLNSFRAAQSRVSSAMRTMGTRVKGLLSPFGSLQGAVMRLAGGVGLMLLSRSFLRAADTAEQYRTRLRVMLGSQKEGNRMFKEMADLAAKVPKTYEEIMDAATTLTGVMKGGVDEVKRWMPLIVDLASATGMTVQAVTGQVMRMYSAGSSAADMFRERGILSMLGFQYGIKYSIEETRKMLMEAWTAPISRFRGASKELAKDWTGITSMMSDKWFKFRTAIMDSGPFQALKITLAGVNEKIDEMIDTGKFDEFTEKVGGTILLVFKKIMIGTAQFADFIVPIIGRLGRETKELWNWFMSLDPWVREVGIIGWLAAGKTLRYLFLGVAFAMKEFKKLLTSEEAAISGLQNAEENLAKVREQAAKESNESNREILRLVEEQYEGLVKISKIRLGALFPEGAGKEYVRYFDDLKIKVQGAEESLTDFEKEAVRVLENIKPGIFEVEIRTVADLGKIKLWREELKQAEKDYKEHKENIKKIEEEGKIPAKVKGPVPIGIKSSDILKREIESAEKLEKRIADLKIKLEATTHIKVAKSDVEIEQLKADLKKVEDIYFEHKEKLEQLREKRITAVPDDFGLDETIITTEREVENLKVIINDLNRQIENIGIIPKPKKSILGFITDGGDITRWAEQQIAKLDEVMKKAGDIAEIPKKKITLVPDISGLVLQAKALAGNLEAIRKVNMEKELEEIDTKYTELEKKASETANKEIYFTSEREQAKSKIRKKYADEEYANTLQAGFLTQEAYQAVYGTAQSKRELDRKNELELVKISYQKEIELLEGTGASEIEIRTFIENKKAEIKKKFRDEDFQLQYEAMNKNLLLEQAYLAAYGSTQDQKELVRRRELLSIEQTYASEIELLQKAGATKIEIEEYIANKIAEIKKQHADEDKLIAEESLSSQLGLVQTLSGEYASLYREMGAANIMGIKKSFAAYKAFSIVEALISSYLAFTKALTAKLPPVVKEAYAASVLALGLAKVSLIRKQQPPSYDEGGVSMRPGMYYAGVPEAHIPLKNGAVPVIFQGQMMAGKSKPSITIDMRESVFFDQDTLTRSIASISAEVARQVAPGAIMENYRANGPIRDLIRRRP